MSLVYEYTLAFITTFNWRVYKFNYQIHNILPGELAYIFWNVSAVSFVISYHIISYHIITSHHITSSHHINITSHHITSSHIISYIIYLIISNHISYHIITYHITSCHVMSCHVMLYHCIWYHISYSTSCIISFHAISYHEPLFEICFNWVLWSNPGIYMSARTKTQHYIKSANTVHTV